MNKDNLILFGSIIILIGSALFFDFNTTGSAVQEYTTTSIDVSPGIIPAGDLLYIDVKTGNKGINNKADFIYAIDNLRKGSKENICGDGAVCTGDISFSYVVSLGWERGIYKMVLYDYDSESFVERKFTVV